MGRPSITCDVLVVGLGVAGIGAAVRAAREGAHTVAIERRGCPGGVAVAGMHRFICGLYVNGEDEPDGTLNGGMAAELRSSLKGLAPGRGVQRMGKVHVLPFARQDLVSSFRSLSEDERKLEILYDTWAVSVSTEQNAIAAITAQNQTGEFDVVPSAVVDCSGDGVIVQMSGAPHQVPPSDQRQLAGYSFRLRGLEDLDGMLPVQVPYYLAKAVKEEEMPPYLRFTSYSPGDAGDEGYFRLNIPPAGPDRREQARQDAKRVHQYLCQVLPAFKGSEIAEMSPEVVYREGARARGEYILSADDVLNARKFADGAVKNAWPIELWDQQTGPSHRYLDPGEYYEIPDRKSVV